MTTFTDGPAAGKTLFLKRAPHYLRVVQGPDGPTTSGDIDALDQLDDAPRSTERIYIYEMIGHPTWIHINRRGKHGSGMFRGGTYRMVSTQPSDDEVRSTAAWRAWVGSQIGETIGEDGAIQE